jgi:Fur family peroxide stress response transcriptional regulator
MQTIQTHQANVDYLLNELEAAGKRATPQRHAICRALVEHGGHPTVSEIFEQVREQVPMISQATVYNTIDTLHALGLIQRLEIANHDHTHYDLDVKPHINVVCRHCEYIADVSLNALDNLLGQVAERTGCEIDTQAGLIVYGVCPECRAQGKTLRDIPPSETCPLTGKKKGHRRRHRMGKHDHPRQCGHTEQGE